MMSSSPTQRKAPYRILMVAPTSFFADYGCHVRILEEVRALQKLGQEITIVTYYKGDDLPNLEIVRTRPVPWREEYEVGSSRHKIGFDVLLSWTALKLALRRRFDLIHAHLHEGALIGGVLAKLRRIPLVFDFQGSLTAEMVDHKFLNSKGHWYKLACWLETRINRLPQVILTSSQHAAGLLERESACDPQRIYAVPDAVNLDFFRSGGGLSQDERASWKASLGIPPGRPVVVYLGLLTDYQGTDKLLQAAVELRHREVDVHFLVMGYPSVAHYRRMATTLGLDGWVTFTGKIPYELAPQHLALGDIAVAPKISATESSGKILNYMAMELPTVTFDVPVSREFLGGLGVYAQVGDPHALTNALQSLLADPVKARSLGRRLRQRAAEHYSWDQAGRQILSIYDRLVQPVAQLEPRHRPALAVTRPRDEGREGDSL
jgi:glycosyltransferase involved in cell wall biosynthesis